MKTYLVGAIGALAGVLALKIAYRKGIKDGVKFSKNLAELIFNEEDEES